MLVKKLYASLRHFCSLTRFLGAVALMAFLYSTGTAPVVNSMAFSSVAPLDRKYLFDLLTQSSMLWMLGSNVGSGSSLISFSMGSKCALRAVFMLS